MRYFRKLVLSVSLLIALMMVWFVSAAIATASSVAPITSRESFQSGITAFQDGNYSTAIVHFTQAIQIDSNDEKTYSNRCLTYLELQDYSSAIADCTQALQLNSSHAEAYLNRGLAYYRLNQYPKAIADYTELLKLKPHDHRAYYNRGLAQADQGAYRAAIVDFGEALRQTSPLDYLIKAEIYNDRGVTQLMLNHPQQAIADLTQSVQFDPTHIGALYNRGCAYHQQGNPVAAVNDFTQVLQRVPNHAQAYLSRGMVRHELGEQEAAIGDLQQAAQSFREQGSQFLYLQTLSLIRKIQSPGLAFG